MKASSRHQRSQRGSAQNRGNERRSRHRRPPSQCFLGGHVRRQRLGVRGVGLGARGSRRHANMEDEASFDRMAVRRHRAPDDTIRTVRQRIDRRNEGVHVAWVSRDDELPRPALHIDDSDLRQRRFQRLAEDESDPCKCSGYGATRRRIGRDQHRVPVRNREQKQHEPAPQARSDEPSRKRLTGHNSEV